MKLLNLKKLNSASTIIILLLILLITQITRVGQELTSEKNVIFGDSNEFIKDVEIRGNKKIIILANGPTLDNKGNAIAFYNKAIINPVKEVLLDNNYTVVTISLPCMEAECISKYFNLGQVISSLDPEAIVFNAIGEGINTDILDEAFDTKNIPVYTFGRRLPVSYELHVGPANNEIGVKAAEGLKNEIKIGDRVIYVETVRLINGDINDNGYPRIDGVRELLKEYGVEEVNTIFTFWSKSKTYDFLLDELSKNKGTVDYIITPSYETGEGAVEAVADLGLKSKVRIIILDFSPQIKDLIENGLVYGAVSQELHKQSSLLSKTILADLKNSQGRENRRTIKGFASKFIRLQNLNEFKDKNGEFLY